MGSRGADSPSARRHQALGQAIVGGTLWSIGNGLTTGNLINYLAQDLGAQGFALSLILAAPSAASLLRLGTGRLIGWLGSARTVCLWFSGSAYLLLLPLPWVPRLAGWLPGWGALAALIALICIHQLLESIGSVALWAWLGQLVPPGIRGRYFARRQVWQLAVLIPTLLASGWWIDLWRSRQREVPHLAYALPTAIGALMLLGSLVPLAAMPAEILRRPRRGVLARAAAPPPPWVRSLAEPAFRQLVAFGAWVGLVNGLTQAAQNRFPYDVLHLKLVPLQVLLVGMRIGQLLLSPGLGRLSDRYGNRPVLIACQLCVATGPLFYLAASPEQPYWIAGAWLVWSAFAGLNLCLPNLALKLSPGKADPGYVATYFALGTLAYASGTLLGGLLLDGARQWQPVLARFTSGAGWPAFDHYDLLFAGGALARALGVLWLVGLAEPGAARWSEIRMWRGGAARGS